VTWITVVDLGSEIAMTRLFDREDDALRYGDEAGRVAAAWLR
jgi:hypothetical protein